MRGKTEEHTVDAYRTCLITTMCFYGHLFYLPGPVGIPAISFPYILRMAPRVHHINCPTERRPGPALGAQLVSFPAPGAFTASELDLLTPVVHKPGNRLRCSDTHTYTLREKKSLLQIIFPLFKTISFHLYFGRRQSC